ncbi:RHS repeat-associated core domain-containing protein [Lutispora sp.]|uniref:RHS repeat-associated core domain-containing protein n=1 Tax=Lutispora sp. TaxID=2828727 RepID=UPI003567DBE5
MPETGRFISEDPWPGDMTDPQTLNPYPYVVNNPLKYVDPLGLRPAYGVYSWEMPERDPVASTTKNVTEKNTKNGTNYSDCDQETGEVTNREELVRRMENGESVIWDGVNPDLLDAKDKFEAAVKAKGWSITYTSAYRPIEYQRHLYELNKKVQSGTATKEEIDDYNRHGLVGVVAKPNPNAPHTRGVAFDAVIFDADANKLNSKDFINSELLEVVKDSGLFTIFEPKKDLIHFQLVE